MSDTRDPAPESPAAIGLPLVPAPPPSRVRPGRDGGGGWAVITLAAGLSLWLVLRGLLGVPIAWSVALFLTGVALYLFYATAVGLLFILIVQPMILLSGGNTR